MDCKHATLVKLEGPFYHGKTYVCAECRLEFHVEILDAPTVSKPAPVLGNPCERKA